MQDSNYRCEAPLITRDMQVMCEGHLAMLARVHEEKEHRFEPLVASIDHKSSQSL